MIAETTERPSLSSWQLQTASGLTLFVPPRLSSLTTFVLLEQERWFEREFDFVPSLLEPDMNALDIGANHGVYALRLAAAVPRGQVWAFEPTLEPRARLLRSVQANGLEGRLHVVPIGLSDTRRLAEFGIGSDSELNSLHNEGGARETVQLDTLDAFLSRLSPRPRIDFVKIDAEGEEAAVLAGGARFFAEQSPLVMFEVKHAGQWNWSLLEQFAKRGYGLLRHLPELDLLAPFDPSAPAQDALLNLFACKPDVRQRLADRGLLAGGMEPADGDAATCDEDAALDRLAQQPFACGLPAPEAGTDTALAAYRGALARTAAAHLDSTLGVAQRLAMLSGARSELALATSASQPAALRLAAQLLQVHLEAALGAQGQALTLAVALLRAWPADVADLPLFMPVQRGDLQRPRHTPAPAWARQQLAEFLHRRSSYSSYFLPADPAQLRVLLQCPDHDVEIERRYVLAEMRHNRLPDRSLLTRLPHAAHTANATLWKAVLAA